MAERIYLPGGVLSMASAAADRLLAAGNGDAALLYLLMMKNGSLAFRPDQAVKVLKWAPDRVRAAFDQLVGLGLADPEKTEPAPPPVRVQLPEYSMADINREQENTGSPFRSLVMEVQRQLGKVLSDADLKALFSVYDFSGLPPEVILMLVNWCIEEHERKYGAGRRPRLPQIQKEALRWKEQGIDTIETADAYLKRLSVLRSRTRQIMALLDLPNRPPVTRERDYIAAWIDMGFHDDAIRDAYERTVLKKQSLNWPYMNSILKNWHRKGCHTLEQVRASDESRPNAPLAQAVPPADQKPGEGDRRARDDMERIRAFMMKQQEGK